MPLLCETILFKVFIYLILYLKHRFAEKRRQRETFPRWLWWLRMRWFKSQIHGLFLGLPFVSRAKGLRPSFLAFPVQEQGTGLGEHLWQELVPTCNAIAMCELLVSGIKTLALGINYSHSPHCVYVCVYLHINICMYAIRTTSII